MARHLPVLLAGIGARLNSPGACTRGAPIRGAPVRRHGSPPDFHEYSASPSGSNTRLASPDSNCDARARHTGLENTITIYSMDELRIPYYQEYEILGYLLYPIGRISDDLVSRVDRNANYPEIILFSKFVLTALSLYRLLPEGKEPQKNKPADISSIATLGRNLIEIYNLYFYLCLDEISDIEADFRRHVSFYHYLHEHHRVGEKMDVSSEELGLNEKNVLQQYRREVEDHPFFQNLERKVQRQVLSGEKMAYQGRVEITKKYCKSFKLLDALYKVMSNHVHSGVFGLILSFDGESFGCDNVENRDKISSILYLVNYYVGIALCSVITIYPETEKHSPKEATALATKLAKRF